MKSIIALAFFVLIFGCQKKQHKEQYKTYSRPKPPATNPILDVIVMAGQSNMVGNNSWIAMPIEYTSPMPFVLTFFKGNTSAVDDGVIQPLQYGVNNNWAANDRTSCGSEISLGSELSIVNARRIGVVKYAYNGSMLVDDGSLIYDAGLWDVNANAARCGTGGKHFDIFVNRFVLPAIAKYKALGYTPRISGFCWTQGEADASRSFQSSHYQERMIQMIDSFKSVVNPYASTANMQVVISRLHNKFRVGERPYLNTVRTAQVNIANHYGVNGHWIDTDTYGVASDSTHFIKQAEIDMGIAMANFILPSLN
jgi:hypothetical protein